ncbi:hypothetical protein KIH74_24385 [Kineosporia sp. J2-2]|uniref:Uncharacterized protein n=1 Tax=Kineosporia corallincola TaxID=2835133 RepID=A0ABS5TQQ4_9ACTN|nr:hypothetical protein [Kineosporia corallincola]MBT0772104.1 hypothetical protein [Kineosporia corallincola]
MPTGAMRRSAAGAAAPGTAALGTAAPSAKVTGTASPGSVVIGDSPATRPGGIPAAGIGQATQDARTTDEATGTPTTRTRATGEPGTGSAPTAQTSLKHLPWGRMLAGLIAMAGLVVLALGGLKATVWAPSDVVVGRLSTPSQKFVTTEVGTLALAGTRVEVTASGSGSVFIGIGRASDVDAYLDDAATQRITGVNEDDDSLITRAVGTDTAAVPDPGSVDVWTVSDLGTGTASLTWPETASGQYRLVIAADGAQAAPQEVTMTWSGSEPSNPAPLYIGTGVVLLVTGVIASMTLRARTRDRRRA